MVDLSTKYMGLELKNPLIISSSGLTMNIDRLIEIEKQGAAAVVLKSLFEEQIRYEGNKAFLESGLKEQFGKEAEDFVNNYIKKNKVKDYTNLIKQAKANLSIPVIASINCVSADGWEDYTKIIEAAGADALEVNLFIVPYETKKTSNEIESIYFEVIENIQKHTQLPIGIKIGSYFTSFASFAEKISQTGISSMVLFNRFFTPDIDIEKEVIRSANLFSTPEESGNTLRWIAILSDIVECDLAASTGIHSGAALVKQLLAGASAVQICSVIYQEGLKRVKEMILSQDSMDRVYNIFYKDAMSKINELLSELKDWMERHNYSSISEFKGKLGIKQADNPGAYTRAQIIKHYESIE